MTSEEAVDTFSNNGQFKLGGNFSVAVGPVGRQGEAAFAPAMKSKVPGEIINTKFGAVSEDPSKDPGLKLTVVNCYSYSHSSGLFAGVSLEGTVLLQRPKDNKKYYGAEVVVRDILNGKVEKPDFDRNLHLLHQSLSMLAQRFDESDEFTRFDNIFTKATKQYSERASYEEIDESMVGLRTSTVFRRKISEVLRDADGQQEVSEPTNVSKPRSQQRSAINSFVPIKQPAQTPNFVKMEQYFTLRKRDTIIGNGAQRIKLLEYEWMVELKTLVIDSGFLYTYGMLTFEEEEKTFEQNSYFDDFEYLMFALVEGGKHYKSLARMKKVMGYIGKRGYQFRYFDLMGQQPQNAIEFEKLFFSIAVNVGPDMDGSPVIGIDMSKLRPETFMDGREGELIQLLIWMIRVAMPDLQAFRAGVSFVFDLSLSTKHNIPNTYLRNKLRKFFGLLASHFPMKLKRIGLVKAFNSKGLKAALSSVGKVVLPSKIRSKIQVLTEEKLTEFLPAESIPIAWGGTRTPFTESSFRKYLRSQGKKYVRTVREITRVQVEVEKEQLF